MDCFIIQQAWDQALFEQKGNLKLCNLVENYHAYCMYSSLGTDRSTGRYADYQEPGKEFAAVGK